MRLRFDLRICCFALMLSVLFVTGSEAAQSGGSTEPNIGKDATSAVERQQKMIANQPKASGSDDWSGEYYYGDGLAANVTLIIGPVSGFSFTWHGCLGLYDQNYGDVQQDAARLRLLPRLPNGHTRGLQGIEEDFYKVRWGARHYLIATGQMVEFANKINSGSEPRKWPLGWFFLKKGDEKKKVTGLPPVPAEYAGYLLHAPLKAQISSVGSKRTDDYGRIDAVVLSIGSAEGVMEGMEFYYFAKGTFGRAKVTKVEAHTSEAELTQDGPHSVDPSPTWKLSTRLSIDASS